MYVLKNVMKSNFSFIVIFFFYPNSTSGSLITSGNGASTYIVGNPFFTPARFLKFDVEFHRVCCVEGHFCNLFFHRRPKLRCGLYSPPFYCKSKINYSLISNELLYTCLNNFSN